MVKAWKEKVVIPTYEPGEPEKNPIFLEKRVYQGSSGVVYPYPVIESISDSRTMREYSAVYLENEFIKVMILPELGGRIQMAYDKIRNRHFIYYNRVIKPALVGLAGPWISGGIEFNWPQHHRPSTFMPVDSTIVENSDGSVSVCVNERERMFHQKGMAAFTLRPGKAYLQIKGVLYNPTSLPQTFLWWANPAVAVNDEYQSVFPGDVNAVFDHGKRAVSSFPIATGTYYKMDYSAGVDISNYRNIKVPTSYMAVNSKYDFEGGYENDTQAGMLHVADHHVSPGKKQWTWGNGDFGRAWDRNLTDEDGPYIELMAGVFTENQPDFTWLMPFEEKSFTQYFLPYRELGIVKNASKDILLNIDPGPGDSLLLKVFATSEQSVSLKVVADSGQVLFSSVADLSPLEVFSESFPALGVPVNALSVVVADAASSRELLSWHVEPDEIRPIPDAAEAALLPADIKTVEQLFLTGQHLEQYRHATFNPVDYYFEGLRRDPLDVRCNNALGLWYIRKGRFDRALPFLETAVKVITRRNPNPYDGEPIFNLGVALRFLGRCDEAYDRFAKSTWNAAWQHAGFLECARISAMNGRWDDALREVDASLVRNWHSLSARSLKAWILNALGRGEEARGFCRESLAIDPFNFGCMYEAGMVSEMMELMRADANDYDQLALDYLAAGACSRALEIWQLALSVDAVTPMTRYYMGLSLFLDGRTEEALRMFREAADVSPRFCFPNRLEAILALEKASELNPDDPNAPYFLGNLYYDKRQYDLAIDLWKRSSELNPAFPTVWRNLALATFNKLGDAASALAMMERAFALDPTDARVFMELDQLHRRLGHDPAERLARLDSHPDLVARRDDLVLERATLLNQVGRYAEAMSLIDSHVFHPWEGGEGKVPAQYQFCRLELAKQAVTQSQWKRAVDLLNECLVYPHHLGEGKLHGAQDNDFYFWLGVALDALGRHEEAQQAWLKGTEGPEEPAPALYYNDAKPDKIFYAALCWRRLGNEDKARGLLHRLVSYGEQHIFDDCKPDYFAVSLPDLLIWDDDLRVRNTAHCNFLMALGYTGLGMDAKAQKCIGALRGLNPHHQGLQSLLTHLASLPK